MKAKEMIANAVAKIAKAMAVGFGGMSASAASESVGWSSRHVNVPGALGSESRTGYATLKASAVTYTGSVDSMSDITNRSLTLSSTTHTMSTGSIVYNNIGKIDWTISGTIGNVTNKMVAYTSLRTTLHASGTVSR